MSLFSRLLGINTGPVAPLRPRLPQPIYISAVREFKRNAANFPRAQIISAFGLNAEETQDHDDLMASTVPWDRIADIITISNSHRMRATLGITEANFKQRIGV